MEWIGDVSQRGRWGFLGVDVGDVEVGKWRGDVVGDGEERLFHCKSAADSGRILIACEFDFAVCLRGDKIKRADLESKEAGVDVKAVGRLERYFACCDDSPAMRHVDCSECFNEKRIRLQRKVGADILQLRSCVVIFVRACK